MANFLFVSASTRRNLGLDPSVVYRCINPSRFAASMNGSHSSVCSLQTILRDFKNLQSDEDITQVLRYAFTCKKIIFHRPTFSFTLALLIDEFKRRGITCTADYDDLIFSIPRCKETSAFERMDTELKRQTLIKTIAKNFDALQLFSEFTVSTPYLAAELKSCITNKSTVIERLPNTPPLSWIEMAKSYFNRKSNSHAAFDLRKIKRILGYFGGTASHNGDFDVIREDIYKYLAKNPQDKFMFCKIAFESSLDLNFPDQVISFPPVCFNELPTLYKVPSVCLAPLKQSSFNKSKSSLKFFECALFGKPLIASYNPSITERYAHTKMLFELSANLSFADRVEEAIQFLYSSGYLQAWAESLELIETETNKAKNQTQSFLMR